MYGYKPLIFEFFKKLWFEPWYPCTMSFFIFRKIFTNCDDTHVYTYEPKYPCTISFLFFTKYLRVVMILQYIHMNQSALAQYHFCFLLKNIYEL